MDLKNKKVAVLGASRSGLAMAELVLELGGQPKISEIESPDAKPEAQKWLQIHQVESEWNRHSLSFIGESDVVLLSPGIRADAEPIDWALKKGIPVLGEIEFAFLFCRIPVIAVTGSNGKTTVVTLIKNILDRAGIKSCLCGNIGTPFSRHVLGLKDEKFVVLEVSSFQLEYINTFKPHIAVLLNISENHLDRHSDPRIYFQTKKKIFMNQDQDDYAILDYQNPLIRDLAKELKAKTVYFNSPEVSTAAGVRNPNHLAAQAVGRLVGVSPEICDKVFAEFKGVEHRLELVCSLNGVDYINDSKSTTAESGRWALESFANPVIMICGGRDKNIDFSVLKDIVRKKVKTMIVIGEAKDKIRSAFADVVNVQESPTLEEAVSRARDTAKEGDCVVFSPMCASFDMFKNFEERGKVFKEIVRSLEHART